MSTTALYKALIEAHVSEDTAERAVEGLGSPADAATKTDLAELETRIVGQIAGQIAASETKMTAQMTGQIAASEMKMTERIAALEMKITAQIAELEMRMQRWNIILASVIIAAVGLMLTAFGLIVKL